MPRAADYHGVRLLRMADDIGAHKEAAHAVPEENIWQVGVLLVHDVVQPVDIPDDIVPAVALGEEALLAAVVDGLAVAKVIVADDDEAVIGEKTGKIVIALDMLGDAVLYLHDAARLAFRRPLADVDAVFSGAGVEIKIRKIRHGKIPPFMLSCNKL